MNSTGFKEGLPLISDNIAAEAGPGYLGIILNTWLLGVLALQCYLYYLNFPDDRLILKLTALFLFLIEILQTIFTVADGFHRYVFGFGDMTKMDEMFLANFDTPFMDAIIALVVQGMYAWRVYHLSKIKWITAFIGFFAFAQALGGLTNGIINNRLHRYSNWKPSYFPVQIVWTVSSAVADTAIAATMSWLLLRESRGLRDGRGARSTVVTRILTLTIETNLASATMAIVVCIMVMAPSIAPPKGNYFLTPAYVLGKLYSNSFMAMLNNRTLIRQDLARSQLRAMGISGGRSLQFNISTYPVSVSLHNTLPSASDHIEIKRTVETFRMNDFKNGDSVEAV